MSARRPGSVRFDPYYKLQRWEPRSLAWIDVQRSFPTEDAAEEELHEIGQTGETWRLMLVSETGRRPLGRVVIM